MPWFRIDASVHGHPKVLTAGNPAIGLWLRAGAWSTQYDTDGRVPTAVAHTLGTQAQAHALVEAGLWTRVGDTGFTFNHWDGPEADGDDDTLGGPA